VIERRGDLLLAAALLLVALVNGLRPVQGERWPPFYDAMRDAGTAQVILEGRYPADNIYPEEALWFNPLTGALVAGGAWVTGWDAPMASTRLGPWFNLFPAVAFYLLCRWWLGRWGGPAGLAAYVLWNGLNIAHNATYSPWLFASQFAQGFFCLSLVVFMQARAQGQWRCFVVAGALHGLTFMTHTGAAVVMGLIVVSMGMADAVQLGRASRNRQALLRPAAGVLLTLGTAFVTSLPYTLPILWRYQMHMINIFPAINVQSPMQLHEIGSTIRATVTVVNAVAVVGFVRLLRSGTPDQRRLAVVWALVLALWVAQVYVWQMANMAARGIPQPVPGHHAYSAVTLFRALCLGAGVITLASWLARRMGGGARVLVPVAVVFLSVVPLPRYVSQDSFRLKAREQSPHAADWEARDAVYQWLRANAAPDDVILADDWTGLLTAAPAARGLVSTMLIFSNPYIDAFKRISDRDQLWGAIRAKDSETFMALAREYGVRFVIARDFDRAMMDHTGLHLFKQELLAEPMAVYRVVYPGE
jgi:hypothetical protein